MAAAPYPLSGMRVLEMGSGTAVPYTGKLLVDAGAEVVKVESPSGDPFRKRSASGAPLADGEDSAWFRFLNAGKASVVLDLTEPGAVGQLHELTAAATLLLDDHLPSDAMELGIDPASVRAQSPHLVMATITPWGCAGPWAGRPANEFTLQAQCGATESRGLPGEEPLSVGGDLGGFIAASLSATTVTSTALAARTSGVGCHLDISQFESMIWAFQVFRTMYDTFAPEFRQNRQIEVPSIEPCADGEVGFCTVTGQQWSDFCAMIGAPELADDPELASFDGRMDRREEVWNKIRAFTSSRTSAELCAVASDMRIPAGPVGTGDVVATFDHFVHQGFFTTSPHGFTQPSPGVGLGDANVVPPSLAPVLGSSTIADFTASGSSPSHATATAGAAPGPVLGTDQALPLAGIKVLDLTAFIAGPTAANTLRVLGADLIKVESHVRLDGMRWAMGNFERNPRWEWSPGYHGVNVGKRVVNLDLSTDTGREIVERLIGEADVVVENFSPRVMESWGLTWERIQQLNPRAILVRMPAFGTEGPWRDRTGFAMTMEQVSGLANRTGRPDGPPLVPKGPVDHVSGGHAAFATVLALAERERTGKAQVVESPLVLGGLQAAAEQVVEFSAYGAVLTRMANRSPDHHPQGVYRCAGDDHWVAVSAETEAQWNGLCAVIDGLAGFSPTDPDQLDAIDRTITTWCSGRDHLTAAEELCAAGVPAAPAVHFNDAHHTPQLDARGFFARIEHPVTGTTPYHHLPVQIDGGYHALGGPAPLLGEHSEAVLAELGFSAEEIATLEESGVTGTWPAMVPRP